MDSTAVNWEALDALVIDFAKSENLIQDADLDSTAACSSLSSSYQTRIVISQIRRFIEIGDIDSAMKLIRIHTPFVLDDHRILFRLHKQVWFLIFHFYIILFIGVEVHAICYLEFILVLCLFFL